jgi:hypothetical protein
VEVRENEYLTVIVSVGSDWLLLTLSCWLADKNMFHFSVGDTPGEVSDFVPQITEILQTVFIDYISHCTPQTKIQGSKIG